MEYLLQILGSIASIGSIPLAIYLYLRSREAKYFLLRQEIVRVLSFQIGEGRELSTFEIQAVIDSKIRANRLKSNSITVDEVIEDLVSETMSSPLLDSTRKAEIAENLKRIHHKGMILQAIDRYGISYLSLLRGIRQSAELTPQDSELLVQEASNLNEKAKVDEKSKFTDAVSSIFGFTVALISLITAVASVGVTPEIRSWFRFPETNSNIGGVFFNLLLGVVASLLASVVTLFAIKASRIARNENVKKDKQDNVKGK